MVSSDSGSDSQLLLLCQAAERLDSSVGVDTLDDDLSTVSCPGDVSELHHTGLNIHVLALLTRSPQVIYTGRCLQIWPTYAVIG